MVNSIDTHLTLKYPPNKFLSLNKCLFTKPNLSLKCRMNIFFKKMRNKL